MEAHPDRTEVVGDEASTLATDPFEVDEDEPSDATEADSWFILFDPQWEGEDEEDVPPEMVVGGWPVHDGGVGEFHLNELHPAIAIDDDPDPIAIAITHVTAGRFDDVLVQAVLRDCMVHVALDEDGRPVTARSPEGRQCIVAVTAVRRREGAEGWPVVSWVACSVGDLVVMMSDDVDLLLNPAGPQPMQVGLGFVLDAADLGDEGLMQALAARSDAAAPALADRRTLPESADAAPHVGEPGVPAGDS